MTDTAPVSVAFAVLIAWNVRYAKRATVRSGAREPAGSADPE